MKKAKTPGTNQTDYAGRAIEKDGIRRDGLHQIFSCAIPPLIRITAVQPRTCRDGRKHGGCPCFGLLIILPRENTKNTEILCVPCVLLGWTNGQETLGFAGFSWRLQNIYFFR